MPSTTAHGRPLRSDAERNREAILSAAAAVYAERGSETSLEAVARLAGVGVGTVYRRFPTKSALIEALLEDAMREYAEHVERAALRADEEPWEAFREHVLALVTAQAQDRAFSEVVSDPEHASPAFRDSHRRALRASLALVAKAKAAGVLRTDFAHHDLLTLMLANHGLVAAEPAGNATRSLRLAELALAGMAASADAAAPPTRPAAVPPG